MFHLCLATQIDRASGTKRRKHSSNEKIALISFDDDVDETDSSNHGEEESRLTEKRSSTGITPSFVGHRVIASPAHSTHRSTVSSMTQQLLAATWKLESQHLRPLLVAQERTEAMTKCLIINQKKIQRALRKQKVSLPFFECVA
jgi:hypothetical protein